MCDPGAEWVVEDADRIHGPWEPPVRCIYTEARVWHCEGDGVLRCGAEECPTEAGACWIEEYSPGLWAIFRPIGISMLCACGFLLLSLASQYLSGLARRISMRRRRKYKTDGEGPSDIATESMAGGTTHSTVSATRRAPRGTVGRSSETVITVSSF